MFYVRLGVIDVRIFFVEDDDGDVKVVMCVFVKVNIGNLIIWVQDGVEVFVYFIEVEKKIQKWLFILLFVDLNMLRMNGIELVRVLCVYLDLWCMVVFFLIILKWEEDMVVVYDFNVVGYIVKQNVGVDFLNFVGMIDSFWKIVELFV